MVGQRSKFLIFGSDRTPANELLKAKGLFESFTIKHSERRAILNDLRRIGITPATVFDTLDHLAKELEMNLLDIFN